MTQKRWKPNLWIIQPKRPGIVKKSRARNINRIKDDWKNVIGVYIFLNRLMHVKYVGYTRTGLKKEAVSAIRRGKGKGATKAIYIQCKSNKDAKKLENELKHMYRPINNKDMK